MERKIVKNAYKPEYFAVYFGNDYIGQIWYNGKSYEADYPGGGSYQLIEEAAADIIRHSQEEIRRDFVDRLDYFLSLASKP